MSAPKRNEQEIAAAIIAAYNTNEANNLAGRDDIVYMETALFENKYVGPGSPMLSGQEAAEHFAADRARQKLEALPEGEDW